MLKSKLFNISPLFQTLANRGGPEQLRDDLAAGLTLGFLAIPQGMAYAVIAGLHPIHGLYAATVAAIAASLFISSRHVITGPTATISVIVAGIMINADLNPARAAVYLCLIVGSLQFLYFLLGIGNLARFVSDAVVAGLVMGSALVIIGDQVLSLLDGPDVDSPYFAVRIFHSVSYALTNPDGLNQAAILLGAVTAGVVGILRQWDERIPASLLALLASGATCWLWNLQEPAFELVGKLPSALPTFKLPVQISFDDVEKLFTGALALSLFSSVQSISIGKSIAGRTHDQLNENQDLLSQAVANLTSGLFGGLPVAASFSRSFFNHKLGGKTQFSGFLSGVSITLLTLLAAPLISYVPLPVLAGIIIVIVGEVIEIEKAQSIWMTTTQDRVAFLTTFLGVVLIQLDFAIYLGIAVSILFYLREATRLDMKEYIVDEAGNLKHITSANERITPGVAVIDVNGEAFFGAADQIQQRVVNLCEESRDLRVIILRMKNAANFDITGAAMLERLARDLRQRGKTLMLCGTTPKIRKVLRQAGASDVIGEDKILVAQKNLLESTRTALERAREHIDEVLDGELERSEEEPELEHTMKQLRNGDSEKQTQDPIETEKQTPQTDSPGDDS